ncbi:hypothetical protein ABR737_43480 [Streptomyces sp. Edi2]|uniref:hypothetical protein n=1 Tax=Streptomyces sp. Edi2 TaxID=3162528 RepID=UPI00330653BD
MEEVTEPFGEPDPEKRAGWQRVMELAKTHEIDCVLVRWQSAVSPRHELRYEADQALRAHGASVRYYWPTPPGEAREVIRP